MPGNLYEGRDITVVSFDSMVDVMILCQIFDVYIDNYRHRRDRCVEVPFSEYINFIMYVLDEKQWLTEDTAKLKDLCRMFIMEHSEMAFQELYRNYILDCLSACVKELHLAECRDREATLIRFGIVHHPAIVKVQETVSAYDHDDFHAFYRRVDLLGYRVPFEFKYPSNALIAQYIETSLKLVLCPRFREFIVV